MAVVVAMFAVHFASGLDIGYIDSWHTQGILGTSLSQVCAIFSCINKASIFGHLHPRTDSLSYQSSERYTSSNHETLDAHCFRSLRKELTHCGWSKPPTTQR